LEYEEESKGEWCERNAGICCARHTGLRARCAKSPLGKSETWIVARRLEERQGSRDPCVKNFRSRLNCRRKIQRNEFAEMNVKCLDATPISSFPHFFFTSEMGESIETNR
jgi:hypothetical protein